MGMVVRTNMAGLNANNALNMASKTQQNAMQKLASGFRINKAADDASGLAISEKMKNQIKALDTAADNCEDGANMIQTAEGYMNETHDILNRMTELAEKAANGVLDDTDRDALQDEMNELCGEIDRMATTANFNGHKLMDGTIGGTDSLTLTCNTATKKIEYSAPSINKQKVEGISIDVSELKKGETYTAKSVDTNNKLTVTDSDGKDTVISTALSPRKGDTITLTGAVAASTTTGTTKTADGLVLSNTDTTTAVAAGTYTYNGTKWVDSSNTASTLEFTDANIKAALGLGGTAKTFTVKEGINLQIGESSTAADRLEVTINSFHTDALFGGLDGFKNETIDSDNTDATSEVNILNSNSASTYESAVTIDISDKNAASAAADAIRQVSNYVSDERGRLGAQQNRLEHTVNNLTTASENTTAANSRIRDTNMAEEMMSYTSKNVVAQAAQAMLAQANSQPQNVLSLLQ